MVSEEPLFQKTLSSRKPQVPEIVENDEISINYVMNKIIWNQNEVNVDNALAYNITINVMSDNEDQDCQQRNDWPNGKMK